MNFLFFWIIVALPRVSVSGTAAACAGVSHTTTPERSCDLASRSEMTPLIVAPAKVQAIKLEQISERQIITIQYTCANAQICGADLLCFETGYDIRSQLPHSVHYP